MKVAELAPELRARIGEIRFDRIVEKHEGPFGYADWFKNKLAEFIRAGEFDVLIPVDADRVPHIRILRCIVGDNGNSLTLFLRDSSYGESNFEGGFLAVCERFPGESFFVSIVYHEWFIIA